jgi:hypothetical protein
VGLVTADEDWRRQVRHTRAARRAARRRHPASGRAQPDRPGMIRVVPTQPDRQPPGPAANPIEENNVTDSQHFHVIAAQDHGTSREWWTIRTNQYDRDEAEQQAQQLLAEGPNHETDSDDLWNDQAETGGDQPEPAWSAVWLTSCTQPCRWASPTPGLTWQLPPAGDPWWTADGITLQPPARTGSVTLVTVQTATWAELKQMGLSDDDLKLLGIPDAELAALTAHPSDRPRMADPSNRPR